MNGKLIAVLRYRMNLTQKQFAEKLNVSESLIAKVEAGIVPLSKRLKTKILDCFGFDTKLLEIVKQMQVFEEVSSI